jgi:hypothetical protein
MSNKFESFSQGGAARKEEAEEMKEELERQAKEKRDISESEKALDEEIAQAELYADKKKEEGLKEEEDLQMEAAAEEVRRQTKDQAEEKEMEERWEQITGTSFGSKRGTGPEKKPDPGKRSGSGKKPLSEKLKLGAREEMERSQEEKKKKDAEPEKEIKPKKPEEEVIELKDVISLGEIPEVKAAREEFINNEKEYQKYLEFALKDKLFKGKKEGKAQVKKEYEEAKEKYEKARSKYVGKHMDRFVDERTKLADRRAEKFEKGKWKKVWDWAGKELSLYRTLEKRGYKIENKFGKFLAKGLNARTLVSLGLLGTGIGLGAGSMVGVSALAAKRIYSGVATGMGSYELMRMAGEKYPRLTDKKLGSINYEQAEKIMAQYEIRARLKGEKVSDNENYQKLKDKYQELLIGENKKANKKADVLIKAADKQLGEIDKSVKRNARVRKVLAVGLGVFVGGVGINRLAEHLGGHSEEAMTLAEENKKSATRALFQAKEKAVDAAAETMEGAAEKLPEKFGSTVQANEGYIHEARKALTQYIHEAGDSGLDKLNPTQKVWAEGRLWDLYREAHPEAAENVLHVGDKIEFSTDNIKQVLKEAQDKFGGAKAAGLSENLKDYVDKVNWGRYRTIPYPNGEDVYAWELDNGVKETDLQAETEALEKIKETKPENSEAADLLNGKEAVETTEAARIDYAVEGRISDMFNLRPDEYEVLKDVPVQKFVSEYSYWNPPEEMIQSNDHLELWRKLKLRDMLTHYLYWHPANKSITVHEYLKECWQGEAIGKIAGVK